MSCFVNKETLSSTLADNSKMRATNPNRLVHNLAERRWERRKYCSFAGTWELISNTLLS